MEKFGLVFLAIIGLTSAQLMCEMCNGNQAGDDLVGKDSACPLTGYETLANKTAPQPCASKACVKYVQNLGKIKNEVKVTRRCLDEDEIDLYQRFHGCRTDSINFLGASDSFTITCVCHNDGCNAASVISSTLTMLSIAAMLTKLF